MTHPQDITPNWAPHVLDAWRQLREARAERDAYRELAQQAIHALHELTKKHERQSVRYYELLDERREQRRAA